MALVKKEIGSTKPHWVFLLNSISAHINSEDRKKVFNDQPNLDVVLTVNGVECDFVKTINSMCDRDWETQ